MDEILYHNKREHNNWTRPKDFFSKPPGGIREKTKEIDGHLLFLGHFVDGYRFFNSLNGFVSYINFSGLDTIEDRFGNQLSTIE